MNRTEKVLAYIDKKGLGLEIGPSYNPIISKALNSNIRTVDHLDRDGLCVKYRHLSPELLDKIEDVDYIWTGGSLVDVIGEVNKFDYIIASHLIEHTVDLIGFLQDCEKLLKPNGVISLAIPDKRFCFDRFKSLSSLGDVIYSHLNKHPFHSIDAIIDHHVYGAVMGSNQLAWNSTANGKLNLHHPQIANLRNQIDEKTFESTYHDVHHWIFTPTSFSLLMQDLHELQFLTLAKNGSFDTSEFEFFISLSKSQDYVEYKDRLEMLIRIENEMTVKMDSIYNVRKFLKKIHSRIEKVLK
ncbi:MAG: class I SAM-dependent methyltransferase [Bacteroidales bacterium]